MSPSLQERGIGLAVVPAVGAPDPDVEAAFSSSRRAGALCPESSCEAPQRGQPLPAPPVCSLHLLPPASLPPSHRIAVFSVTVLHDERVVIVAEQRPDSTEEDSFQWMSRVLQV